MTIKNPWRGLASYEEPQGNEQDYLFCGRDEETLDMVRLIENNLFVTLYGSSGIGKTSLLKAGVIPILRRKDYFPLYVRLSQEDNNISYAEAIVNKLRNSGLHEERRAALEHANGNDRLYLWNYFATTRFRNADGREVYPVIILDQFEEVFRDADKRKAELLLKQIYLLLNDELEMPAADGYSADTNYRFVASIREDFLFVLEDSIDENSLDLYKNNRYRLRPMKPDNARQVVLVPGKDCVEESLKQEIAEKLVALAKRNKHNDIDTILLSLVCAGTFDKRAGDRITLSDLSIWKNNPMDVYYHDAIRSLSADQIRYIQKNLIREDGSRRRVAVDEVKSALGEETYNHLTQGQSRMLTLGEQGQVELLHDQMALAVFEERKAFEEKERKQRQRKRKINRGMWIGLLSVVAIMLMGLYYMAKLNNEVAYERMKANKNLSKYIADISNHISDTNSYLAQRVLLEVMPENDEDTIKHPYTDESIAAFRKATTNVRRTINGHTDNVNSVVYSLDGNHILSSSEDGTIKVWDAITFKEERQIQWPNYRFVDATFSHNDSCIIAIAKQNYYYSWREEVSRDYSCYFRIWDALTGDSITTIKYDKDIASYVINRYDDKIAILTVDGNLDIWSSKTGNLINKINIVDKRNKLDDSYRKGIISMDLSHDGERLIAIFDDRVIREFDIYTGKIIVEKELDMHFSYYTTSIKYNNDGNRIIIIDYDRELIVLNANTLDEIYKTKAYRGEYFERFICLDDEIVVLGDNGNLYVVDNEKGLVLDVKHVVEYNYYNRKIDINPDKIHIVTTDEKTIMVWEADTSNDMKEYDYNMLENYNACFAFSPDGTRFTYRYNSNSIIIRDVNTGDSITTLKCDTDTVKFLTYSHDGKSIVSASCEGNIQLWNAITGDVLHTLKGHEKTVLSVNYSPDDKYIVSASTDSTIRIWNAKTGKEKKLLRSHHSAVRYAGYCLDDKHIISTSRIDTTMTIWDVNTGDTTKSIQLYKRYMYAEMNHDRNKLAITMIDSTLWICDLEELKLELCGKYTDKALSVCYSHDDTKILCPALKDTIYVWDAVTKERIGKLGNHGFYYNAMYDSDDKHIVALGINTKFGYVDDEGKVKDLYHVLEIWDSKKQIMVNQYRVYDYFDEPFILNGLEYSPDDRYVAVVSVDGKIRIYNVGEKPIQNLVKEARERFKDRPLTDEERRKYYLE